MQGWPHALTSASLQQLLCGSWLDRFQFKPSLCYKVTFQIHQNLGKQPQFQLELSLKLHLWCDNEPTNWAAVIKEKLLSHMRRSHELLWTEALLRLPRALQSASVKTTPSVSSSVKQTISCCMLHVRKDNSEQWLDLILPPTSGVHVWKRLKIKNRLCKQEVMMLRDALHHFQQRLWRGLHQSEVQTMHSHPDSLWLEAGGVEVDEAAGFQAGDDPLVLSALCCGLELSTKITWLVLE